MTSFDRAIPRQAKPTSRGPTARLLAASVCLALVAGIAGAVAIPGGADRPGHAVRIGEAFRAADAMRIDQAVARRVAAVARKADRLPVSAGCGAQTWPHIHPPCLARADGAAPARAVRTVTVEYLAGERTSVLVRLPAVELAANSNE